MLSRALVSARDRVGQSDRSVYCHKSRGLRLNVHGDDFAVVGGYVQLQWLQKELKRIPAIDARGILERPGSRLPAVTHHISVLNRLVTWTSSGMGMEADPRHSQGKDKGRRPRDTAHERGGACFPLHLNENSRFGHGSARDLAN